MDKDQELRGWKAHCVYLQDKCERLELENSRLQAVIDEANAQEPVYQWRIDGDEGWIDCTKEWFDEIYYSHENRILYASQIPSQQSQAVAVTEDNAWIIEKLSYHKFERDDLSIDDCLKYLSSEWTEVAGRTTRQLVMQILYLLASSQLPRVTEREAKNG